MEVNAHDELPAFVRPEEIEADISKLNSAEFWITFLKEVGKDTGTARSRAFFKQSSSLSIASVLSGHAGSGQALRTLHGGGPCCVFFLSLSFSVFSPFFLSFLFLHSSRRRCPAFGRSLAVFLDERCYSLRDGARVYAAPFFLLLFSLGGCLSILFFPPLPFHPLDCLDVTYSRWLV